MSFLTDPRKVNSLPPADVRVGQSVTWNNKNGNRHPRHQYGEGTFTVIEVRNGAGNSKGAKLRLPDGSESDFVSTAFLARVR